MIWGERYGFKKITSIDEFKKKLGGKCKNILIGKGFGLSHPTLGEAFKWDLSDALKKRDWSKLLPKNGKDRPECDLSDIRIAIAQHILKHYITKLATSLEAEAGKEDDIDDILFSELWEKYSSQTDGHDSKKKKFFVAEKKACWDNIFTLNDDPIIYWRLLKYTNYIVDGFYGDTPTKPAEIIKRLYKEEHEGKSKIFYLHGSWFIRANNKKDELSKLSFSSKDKEVKKYKDIWKNDHKPLIVLEDRHIVKKELVKENAYLNHCFERLGKIEGELLIFGASFKNDDHILKQILENPALRKIHYAVVKDEEFKVFQNKCEEIKKGCKEKIQELKVDQNLLWK